MKPKTCRLMRRQIDESDFNAPLSGELTTHLEHCGDCRKFQQERTRLRQLVGSLEPVMAPADFDLRLRARIASEHQRPSRSFFSQFIISTPAMAAVSLLIVFAASLVWFSQHRQTQSPGLAASQPPQVNSAINIQAPPNKAPEPSDAVKTATTVNESARTRSAAENARRSNSTLVARAKGPTGDFNSRPAISIKQSSSSSGEVSLSAPDKPLVVSVEDDHGAKRRILLPPVSFGAQKLVDYRMPVGSSNSRSW